MTEDMVERMARLMWERTHDGSWPQDAGSGNATLYRHDARAALSEIERTHDLIPKPTGKVS